MQAGPPLLRFFVANRYAATKQPNQLRPFIAALYTKGKMEELLDRKNAEFDESEGWIRIVDADWYASDLRLSLSVQMCDDSLPEVWEV